MRKKLLLISVVVLALLLSACLVACGDIGVNDQAKLVSVAVAGQKERFVEGEEFSVGEAVVTATYSNGKTETIDLNSVTIDYSSFDGNRIGKYKINLKYNSVSCTYYVNVVSATGHAMTHYPAGLPTCTKAGHAECWYCSDCGKYFSDEAGTTEILLSDTVVAATGHSYDDGAITTAPTCTRAGVKTFTCTECGATYTEEVAATGHHWNNGKTTTMPTCTAAGVKAYVCQACGERRTEAVAATGHEMLHHPTTLATCTKAGNTEYWHCMACGKYFGDESGTTEIMLSDTVVAATGHSYDNGEITTAPTCTRAGVRTFTCTACGATYTEAVAATGHNYNNGEITTAPTCTRAGVRTFTCTACGATYTEAVAAAGHTMTHHAAVSATCTKSGNTEYWHCTACGKYFGDESGTAEIALSYTIVAATGHSWGGGAITAAPTCTEVGEQTYTCLVCGATRVEPVAATGHSWNGGELTAAPTCTMAGVRTYTCVACGETYEEVIAATGHTMTRHAGVSATCTAAGSIEYWQCSVCGKYFSNVAGTTEILLSDTVVAATGHSYDDGEITTAPTCTMAGVRTYTCTACGATYTETVAATGHTMTHHAAFSATCTAAGSTEYWYCAACGKYFGDEFGTTEILLSDTIVSATGHSWGGGAITATPTCTVAGVRTYICTACGATYTETVAATGHTMTHHAAVSATCTAAGSLEYWQCSVCGKYFSNAAGTAEIALPETVVAATGHSYDDGEITSAPTCTMAGVRTYTCTVCGATYTETVAASGHTMTHHAAVSATCTAAGSTEYWQCSVCGKYFSNAAGTTEIALSDTTVAASGHNFDGGVNVAGNCSQPNRTVYTCTACGYSYFVEGSQYGGHEYQGDECIHCGEDIREEYVAAFAAHGASSSDLIGIDSEKEYVCFVEYIFFNYIDVMKYYQITYMAVSSTNYSALLVSIVEQSTAATWAYMSGAAKDSNNYVVYAYMRVANKNDITNDQAYDYTKAATVTPESGEYIRNDYAQQNSVTRIEASSTRAASFDAFEYYNYERTLAVSTSNQLYYAFAHGYKPVCASGSAAEAMLAAAKTVLRSIVDDDMSDVEKLMSIYEWFVKEIAYDNGAIVYSKSGGKSLYGTAWMLEGVFTYHTAVCDGISKAFVVLARMEGITCVRVTGNQHAWNKVLVDGNGDGAREWYGIDATFANLSISDNGSHFEFASYDDFMFTDAQKAQLGYEQKEYSGTTAATTVFNVYQFMTYEYSGGEYDMLIESSAELQILFEKCDEEKADFESETKYLTVEFIVTFCYTESELTSALAAASSVSGSSFTAWGKISSSAVASTYGYTHSYCVLLYFVY